jgi:hypothetical protein
MYLPPPCPVAPPSAEDHKKVVLVKEKKEEKKGECKANTYYPLQCCRVLSGMTGTMLNMNG